MMDGIRFCGCGCQSENPFVCFGVKPTQRACMRDLPWDRKWTREGRSKRGQKDTGRRRDQSTEQISQEMRVGQRRDQSTEQVSQEMRLRQRGDQSTEVRKAAARTC